MSGAALTAVLLAAGRSDRMGRPKALLPLGGRKVAEQVVATLRGAAVEEIRVVVGPAAGEIAPLLRQAGARIIVNPAIDRGMLSSVQAGLRDLPAGCAGVLIQPVDIALVRPWTIRWLVARFLEQPGRIVHPLFEGRRGHPPVLPARLVPDILAWQAPGGLRAVLENRRELALDVDVPDRNVLFDMDTPADYQEALRRWEPRMVPDTAECLAILERIHPVTPRVLAHSRMVARVAAAFCRALNAAGEEMDCGALHAAALLHDSAKGRPDHARAGAERLREMGFERVARIVAAHTDPPGEKDAALQEEEVLFLADKLVKGDRLVSLEARFADPLSRFGSDPKARRAIEARLAAARRIARRIEERLGQTPQQVLAAADCGPTPR